MLAIFRIVLVVALLVQGGAARAALDPRRIAEARTADEAHATIQYIKAELPPGDGLAAFNDLYMATTANIWRAAREGRFENGPFIEHFIAKFANLYFAAVRAHLDGGGATPLAWQTVFHRQELPGRYRSLQFAMTGMSAHIGHDLPIALKSLFEERAEYPAFSSPEYRDYELVNQILGETFDQVEDELFKDFRPNACEALFRSASDVAAIPSIKAMRLKAWFDGKALWRLRDRPLLSWNYLTGLDVGVAAANRAIFAVKPRH